MMSDKYEIKIAGNAGSEECLKSIAISLKRIADKLELSQKQPIIMDAAEYAEYKGQLK